VVSGVDSDPTFYPILSEPGSRFPVETTVSDGNIAHVTADGARVLASGPNGDLSVATRMPPKLKWDVLITDTRVIVYCEKFDKGGGWGGWGLGGLAIAATANAVSKARAAHRRKGKYLVAQVRYAWLEHVLASPKQGWSSHETLRLRVNAEPSGANRMIMLELDLPKQIDANSVAHKIATRAARYRLVATPDMEPEERAKFEQLAETSLSTPKPSTGANNRLWTSYAMPSSYRVSKSSAFLGINDESGVGSE